MVWYTKLPSTVLEQTPDDKLHALIRYTTAGIYTHVGLYLGQGRSLDIGKKGGVQVTGLGSLLNAFEVANVIRWPSLSQKQARIIVAYGKQQIGRPYDRLGACLMPLRRIRQRRRWLSPSFNPLLLRILDGLHVVLRGITARPGVYCSQLIVEAYEAAGVFDKKDVQEQATAPNDFINMNWGFEYAGYLSRKPRPEFHPHDVNAPIHRTSWVAAPRT